MTGQIDRLKTALADRYTIQEELGAGGMATVYLAEDPTSRVLWVHRERTEMATVTSRDLEGFLPTHL